MPEIHYVQAQIGKNRVAEGFYTIDSGVLTMVFSDGLPVLLPDGSRVTHQLTDGEVPKAVAQRLTVQVRKALVGGAVDGFSSPIQYPSLGIA